MILRTPGLLPLPPSVPALVAELERIERERGHTAAPAARRLFAIERRRVIVLIDQLEWSSAA